MALHVLAAAWPHVKDAPGSQAILAASQSAVALASSAEGNEASGQYVGEGDNALLATALVLNGVAELGAALGSPVEFTSSPADLAAFAKFLLQQKKGTAGVVGQVCLL
jgi:hypothetical protein